MHTTQVAFLLLIDEQEVWAAFEGFAVKLDEMQRMEDGVVESGSITERAHYWQSG